MSQNTCWLLSLAYTYLTLYTLKIVHLPGTNHQENHDVLIHFLTHSVFRRDRFSNTLSTILQTTVKISFMLTKPPPLVQITQLVPTSSFNLKTTSQSSTATEKSSLTTFRRVQPHDERCLSDHIENSTLQRTHMLIHASFWLNQHQHTSHRPF